MRLITEHEFTQMEQLLASLLKEAKMADKHHCTNAQADEECLGVLKLHARLLEIYENQSALRNAQERLQQLICLDATEQTCR